MAVTNWLARAAARAQVETVTIALTWAIADVANVTINGKTVTFTATANTIANVVAGLLAALQASTIVEFLEITWASPGAGTITGTGKVAGKPFTVTASETTAGNGTCTTATTTAATGPNHVNDANNWSGAAVPVNGDEVNVDLSKGSMLYGLDQSAVTLAVCRIFRSSQTSNRAGLPLINTGGYTEYRETSLKWGATLATLDADCPVYFDFGLAQTACEVLRTAGALSGVPETRLIGSHASNVWEINSGFAAIGLFPGQTSNGATLRVNANASMAGGVDADFVNITNGGTLDISGVFTTFANEGGQATIRGDQNATTLAVTGGTVIKRFSGTIADVVVGPGTIDASQDLSPATFQNTVLEKDGVIKDPAQTITHNSGIEMGDTANQVQAA
jgi:hypothetical protein